MPHKSSSHKHALEARCGRIRWATIRTSWLLVGLGVVGCSGSETNDGVASSVDRGGSASTSNVTGGSKSSGGTPVADAGRATGGAGVRASGGNSVNATGGTDALATGGSNTDTGGAAFTGGAASVGGTRSTGGAPSTGGSKATGGANSTGGSTATGGTNSTGGSGAAAGTKATGGSASGGAQSTGGGSGCFTAPATQIGSQASGGRVSGYGMVSIMANSSHQIVRLQTKMVVPPKPSASGTLFLWPGLQPGGANFDPIDNGVLQPVLTWGSSCAPGTQPRAYSTWWISGQYVNTYGSKSGYTGCNGGPVMSVNVCDTLDIDMKLSGTVWTQTITDGQTGKSVDYSIDMLNQSQNLAYFVIEEYSSAPVSEVIFTNTTLTFGSSDASDCKLNLRGQNDYVSTPVASSDGLTCSIDQIILRAQGIQ